MPRPRFICPECGYDLGATPRTGVRHDYLMCPECGHRGTVNEADERLRDHRAAFVRWYDDHPRLVFWLVFCGLFLVGAVALVLLLLPAMGQA